MNTVKEAKNVKQGKLSLIIDQNKYLLENLEYIKKILNMLMDRLDGDRLDGQQGQKEECKIEEYPEGELNIIYRELSDNIQITKDIRAIVNNLSELL